MKFQVKSLFCIAAISAISLSSPAAVTPEQAAAAPEDTTLNRTFAQEQLAEGNLSWRSRVSSALLLLAHWILRLASDQHHGVVEPRWRGGRRVETILTLSLPEADLQRARDLLVRIEKANAS